MPPLRERELVLRGDFDALLRGAVLGDDFEAPPVARLAVERLAEDLRVLDERVAPPVADLALVARAAVDRLALDLRPLLDLFDVDLRAGAELLVLDAVEPSMLHLPDITR